MHTFLDVGLLIRGLLLGWSAGEAERDLAFSPVGRIESVDVSPLLSVVGETRTVTNVTVQAETEDCCIMCFNWCHIQGAVFLNFLRGKFHTHFINT